MTAVSLPFVIADFQARIPIQSCPGFSLSHGQETSRQGSGVIIVKDLRPALWITSVTTAPIALSKTAQLKSRIDAMEEALAFFYMYDPHMPQPQSGPIDDSGVLIHSLSGDLTKIALEGVPVGTVLQYGDVLSFDYGATPSRAYHRIIEESKTTDGTGVISQFQVKPAIRTGAEVGASVALMKANALMMIQPGSVQINSQDVMFNTISFNAIQVIQ